ncbi:MAG: DUF3089 domain-containing protein [Chitinophagaceae bacterium]
MHKPQSSLLFYVLCLFFTGCSPKYTQYISRYKNTDTTLAPNYRDLYYWAAHPQKRDPSDSVPRPLRKNYLIDTTADVFFLYPTTFTNFADTGWNANINDANLNAKTDYTTILYQASAFNDYNIYSPRYRQANIRAYFTTDTANAKKAFDTAYADIKNAFQFYLDNYNHGKPIIIASHSQGSTHAQRLLKEFFDGKPLQQQLAAAYVIGMYIPNNKFTSLKMCNDSLQTGCICGWRTYKKEYEPDFVIKENGTGLITNPLNWTTTTDYANNELNKGSILLKFNKLKKHLTDAQIHDGVLWIGRLHFSGGILIKRKNYHIGDINLFYVNVREDVKRRVTAFQHANTKR